MRLRIIVCLGVVLVMTSLSQAGAEEERILHNVYHCGEKAYEKAVHHLLTKGTVAANQYLSTQPSCILVEKQFYPRVLGWTDDDARNLAHGKIVAIPLIIITDMGKRV